MVVTAIVAVDVWGNITARSGASDKRGSGVGGRGGGAIAGGESGQGGGDGDSNSVCDSGEGSDGGRSGDEGGKGVNVSRVLITAPVVREAGIGRISPLVTLAQVGAVCEGGQVEGLRNGIVPPLAVLC
jgi:hypothetical protein